MKLLRGLFLTVLLVSFFCLEAWALPNGEKVENGSATFDRPNPSTLNITASNQTVINFNSFNIAQNEQVNFIQPSASASCLSRVIGPDPSLINGNLSANGMLFLVNPNGVYVGATANINVHNLVISTMDISTNNFINGNYILQQQLGGKYGYILNEGRITGDNIALIASAVNNAGIIMAKAGTVSLASGDKVTVSFDARGLIKVEVNEKTSGKVFDMNGNSIQDAVKNSGTIEAGQVMMSAKTASDIFQNAVNNTGIVKATGTAEVNGVIKIIADGSVKAEGSLIATESIEITSPDSKVKVLDAQAQNLKIAALEFNIYSKAVNTEIIKDSTIYISKAAEGADGLITLLGEGFGTVQYLKTNNITIRTDNDIVTDPGVIIPGNTVTVAGDRFGSSAAPLVIDAAKTHITRLLGNIDIQESTGIGTSIMITGPPDGFGKIIYSQYTALCLETTSGGISVSGNSAIKAHSISLYSYQNIGSADQHVYFTADQLNEIISTNGSIFLDSNNTLTYIRGNITAYGDVNIYSGTGKIDALTKTVTIHSETGSINLETTTGNIDVYGTFSAPNGTIRFWTSTFLDFWRSTLISKNGGYIWNPEDLTANHWVANSGGSWTDPANWNTNSVPQEGVHDVYFDQGYDGCNGDCYNVPTWNSPDSIFSITDYSGTITLAGNLSIGTFVQSGGTFTCGSNTMTVSGSFTLAGGIFNAPGSFTYVGGNWTRSGTGTFNNNGGTVEFNGYGNTSINTGGTGIGKDFYNLTISGAGIFTQASDLAITNIYSQTYGGGFSDFYSDPSKYSFTITSETGQFNLVSGNFERWVYNSGTCLIYDIYGLQSMNSHPNYTYKLDDSVGAIDATQTRHWNSGSGFMPLGTAGSGFSGNFDGNNKTISGLYINGGSYSYLGLFGYTVTSGTNYIQNITLTNETVAGSSYLGGLVGMLSNGFTISNCRTEGMIYNGSSYVGGLIGYVSAGGTIQSSSSSCTVNLVNGGVSTNVGGLIGYMGSGTISNCYAEGNVMAPGSGGGINMGGLVGYMGSGTISNCYAEGNVMSTGSGESMGGLIGRFAGYNFPINRTISNCYAEGNVMLAGSGNYIGGLVGYMTYGGDINNCYAEGNVMVAGSGAYIGGLGGCFIDGHTTNSYATGDVALMGSGGYIGGLIGYLGGGSGTINNCYAEGDVALMGGSGGYAGGLVGYMTDGSGNITNCYAEGNVVEVASMGSGGYVGGLFGYMGGGSGAISNCYAEGDVALMGGSGGYVGGLFGYLSGNIYPSGNRTISNCHAEGNVMLAGSGGYDIGGLAGYMGNGSGAISNCYAEGNVMETGSGGFNIGGLIGYMDNGSGTISNCYAKGNVTETGLSGYNLGGLIGDVEGYPTISNCHAEGDVMFTGSGGFNIGGLAGFVGNGSGTIDHCYAEGNVMETGSGGYNIGGLAGVTYGSSINYTYATGEVTAINSYAVGGLVGCAYGGGESECFVTSTATVKGVSFVGGLVGYNQSSQIYLSYATNAVTGQNYVGGLVGENYNGAIIDTYATGTVTVSGEDGGGLIGYNRGSGNNVQNSYSASIVQGLGTYQGGFTGYDDGGNLYLGCYRDYQINLMKGSLGNYPYEPGNGYITPMWTSDMMDQTKFVYGGDFNTTQWYFNGVANYPVLSWQPYIWVGSSNWSVGSNWDRGTAPLSSSWVIFNNASSNDCSIDTSYAPFSLNQLNIDSGYTGTITLASDFAVSNFSQSGGTFTCNSYSFQEGGSGAFAISGGTFNAPSGTFTVCNLAQSGGIFNAPSGSFTVYQNWTQSGGIFNPNSGSVIFSSVDPHTINTGGTGAGRHFYDMCIEGSGGSSWTTASDICVDNLLTVDGGSFTLGGNLSAGSLNQYGGTFTCGSYSMAVNGTFGLYGGSFTAPSSTLTVGGDWTQSSSSSFMANSGTVEFTGTGGSISMSGSGAFYNLIITGGGSYGFNSSIQAYNFTLTGDTTLSLRGAGLGAGYNFTITDGSTLDLDAGWIGFGSGGSGTFTIDGNSTIMNSGGTGSTIDIGEGHLCNIYGGSGSFDTSGGGIEVNFTGTGTIMWTPGNVQWSNVVINLGAFNDTVELAGGAAKINGDLTVTKGRLDAYTNNTELNVTGSVTIGANGTLLAPSTSDFTVGGNWDNSAGGTFTPNGGTVTFDGTNTANFYGNTTFYNLTCTTPGKSLLFSAWTTQTIDGALTINSPDPDNKITLALSTGTRGTDYWNIIAPSNTVVSGVIVYDSQSMNDIDATNSTDGNSHSSRWVFTNLAMYWIATGTENWGDFLYWSYSPTGGTCGRIPTSADDVYFTNSRNGDCYIYTTTPYAHSIIIDGYAGIITQSLPLTIVNYKQYSGTYLQNADFAVTGYYYQDAGTFTSDPAKNFSAKSFSLVNQSLTFARFSGGNGSSGNPYQIFDVYGLQAMKCNLSSCFVLTGNIDASGTINWDTNLDGVKEGFSPIGMYDAYPFTGGFDGRGYNIKNLTINRPYDSYIGLFGYVDTSSDMKNASLTDVYITGGIFMGAFIGYDSSYHAISNVSSSGTVNAVGCSVAPLNSETIGGLIGFIGVGVLNNCHASGNVMATGSGGVGNMGGLVGEWGNGTINNCYTEVNVTSTGSGSYMGGLVGYMDSGTINNCYTEGNVMVVGSGNYIGGLIGYMSTGTIDKCYATGDMMVAGSGACIGGLVGGMYSSDGDITNSYATGNVTLMGSGACIGGLVGGMYYSDGDITNSYATGNVALMGSGFFSDYAGVGGLVGFMAGGNGTISNCYAGGNVIEAASMGPGGGVGGLVGYMDSGSGAITNCYAEGNVTVTGLDSNSNITYVGGLVGLNNGSGTFSNCYAEGDVTVTSSGSGGYVGGLVGLNSGSGTISNCYAEGNVMMTGSGVCDIGGLVGLNSGSGTISNCYAEGNVTVTSSGSGGYVGGLIGETGTMTIDTCYAEGNVTVTESGSGSAIGGLVGYAGGGYIQNCYSAGNVKAFTGKDSGGAIGSAIGGLVGENNDYIYCSYATGEVAAVNGWSVGGLVGYNYGTIGTGCFVTDTATVTGDQYVGGLVGYNSWYISNSYATNAVTGNRYVGGLVGGADDSYVGDSYATGTVTVNTDSGGGLIGVLSSNRNIVEHAYASGIVHGRGTSKGGFTGTDFSGDYRSCYWLQGTGHNDDLSSFGGGGGSADVTPEPDSAMKDIDTFLQGSSWYIGTDYSQTWNINDGNSYPTLSCQPYIWTGSGDWSDGSNWNTGTVPRYGSWVIFSSISINSCSIYSSSSVDKFTIDSGYAGYIYVSSSGITVEGPFSMSGGTLYLNSSSFTAETYSQTGGVFASGSGSVSVGSGGFSLSGGIFTAPSGSFNVTGNWACSGYGAFDPNGGIVYLQGSGTVSMIGKGDAVCLIGTGTSGGISMVGSGLQFYDLAIYGGYTANTDINIFNNFNIYSGSFAAPPGTITVGGDWTCSSNGSFSPNTGEVKFVATGTGHTIDAGGSDFYDITFDGTGGDWTVISNLNILHNFTVSSGNVDMSNGSLSVIGSYEIASSGTILSSAQRTSFFDNNNGVYWAFYYDGSKIKYAWSSYGTSWTYVGYLSYSNTPNYSVAYKNGYVYVAAQDSLGNIDLSYGPISYSPAPDISWSNPATYQHQVFASSVSAPLTNNYSNPTAAIDDNGYIWVGAIHYQQGLYYQAEVVRSTYAYIPATWTSSTSLGDHSATLSDVLLVPGTGSIMNLVTNGGSQNIVHYIYDGASWSQGDAGGDYSWFAFPYDDLDGAVNAMALIGTSLYLGGNFTVAGTLTVNHVVRWTGGSMFALGTSSVGTDDVVMALATDGTDLYVGGLFYTAGGIVANGIAKWSASATTPAWSVLGTTPGVSSGSSCAGVYTLTFSQDKAYLYAGGRFDTADTALANNIAQWSMAGLSWSQLGTGGTDGDVYALAVSAAGDLYVGGAFSAVGAGTQANNIAKWTGSTWSALGTSGGGVNKDVYALAFSTAGDLYVGGAFTTAGGNAANHIAKWSSSTWSALGTTPSGGGVDGDVYALAFSTAGDLYVGGAFSNAGGNPASNIAKWSTSFTWSAVGTGVNDYVNVLCFDLTSLSVLYVCGNFTKVGGTATHANYTAQYNLATSTWSTLTSGTVGANGSIFAMVALNSDLYIGGDFTTIGGVTVNYIAEYTPLTNQWQALNSTGPIGVSSYVNALATDGTYIYLGGMFDTAGSSTVNRVAKYNPSDHSFSALGTGVNGYVMALAEDECKTYLYVGGAFTSAGGVATNYIARYDGSWSALPSSGSGLAASGSYGYVDVITPVSGDLYIGGSFNTADGTTVKNITKYTVISPTTGSYSSLGAGSNAGTSGPVKAITVDPDDGAIYVGGTFAYAGDSVANTIGIAKYTPGSDEWESIGVVSCSSAEGGVYAITFMGSDMYVGGNFVSVNNTTVNNVAKYTSTHAWAPLNTDPDTDNIGVNDSVYALASVADITLYAGGIFTKVKGLSTGCLAKYDLVVAEKAGTGLSCTTDTSGNLYIAYTNSLNQLLCREFNADPAMNRLMYTALLYSSANSILGPTISFNSYNNTLSAFWINSDSKEIYTTSNNLSYGSNAAWDTSACTNLTVDDSTYLNSVYSGGKTIFMWQKDNRIMTGEALNREYKVYGNWDNSGTVNLSSSVVALLGSGAPSVRTGGPSSAFDVLVVQDTVTFRDALQAATLSASAPGEKLSFSTAGVNTIARFYVKGSGPDPITLGYAGSHPAVWNISTINGTFVSYANILGSVNKSPGENITAINSIDSGYNMGWTITD